MVLPHGPKLLVPGCMPSSWMHGYAGAATAAYPQLILTAN